MPIYEYVCRQCNQACELLIRGQEAAICPSCGSQQLAKQLSVPAAPATAASKLPICPTPVGGGCGRPQCGTGGCQMLE